MGPLAPGVLLSKTTVFPGFRRYGIYSRWRVRKTTTSPLSGTTMSKYYTVLLLHQPDCGFLAAEIVPEFFALWRESIVCAGCEWWW